MDDIQRRIAELSPEKRQLLDILLRERGAENVWASSEYAAPRNTTEAALAEIWAKALGLPRVGIHDNFFELGGDSIQCIQILAKARHANIQLSANQMFAHPTIAELAEMADAARAPACANDPVGSAPLTPVQAWFFEQRLASPHHWNQAVLLECDDRVDAEMLAEAFEYIVRHHDALRLRWDDPATGAGQRIAPREDTSFFSVLDSSDPIEEHLAAAHRSLDLVNGPIIRVLFLRGSGLSRLLVVAHHLAVDAVSFRILVEDLETLCRQRLAGEPMTLPPKTTSFREWALRLNEYADTEDLRKELPAWTLSSAPDRLPLDFADGSNDEASGQEISVSLSAEQTGNLRQRIASGLRAQMDDTLLAALHGALSSWGVASPLIHLEGHGRVELFPGLDLSRTVGWFTSITPLHLATARVAEIRRLRKTAPANGVGYGILRYLTRDPEVRRRLVPLSEAQIAFNYLGQFDHVLPADALFRVLDFSPGSLYSPAAQRRYILQVTARISEGRLQITWYYSRNLHRPQTIEQLSEQFLAALWRIGSSELASESVTPEDFPLAGLSQQDLDRLIEI